MQVFDDGRSMWLQFPPNTPVPAIFSRTPRGDTPLAYRRDGPYVVVSGVWPALVLRGGHLQSFVERLPPRDEAVSAVSDADPGGPAPVAAPSAVAAVALDADPGKAGAGPVASTAPVAGGIAPAASARPLSAPSTSSAPSMSSASSASSAPVAKPDTVYEVSPSDRNIRLALARWAKAAGWTFTVAHWAVDVDIPIIGSARFETGFKPSVRALLASTELADRPLQACFYSNSVLRVVSYAQPCDRTGNRAGSS